MRSAARIALGLTLLFCGGCPHKDPNDTSQLDPRRLRAAHFNDPLRAVIVDTPLELRAARNETIHFALQIEKVPLDNAKTPAVLKIQPPRQSDGATLADVYTTYQVLSMPFDDNRAGFVRHTGLPVSTHQLPRALLRMSADPTGAIRLSNLRHPDDPTNPQSHATGATALVWVDITIPPTAKPGDYQAKCEIIEDGKTIGTLPLKLTVYDFVIPVIRHLHMGSQITWESLKQFYPSEFGTVTASWLNRTDPKYAGAVRALDDLVKLAHENRAEVSIQPLQPIVKWAAGQPQFDWEWFDNLVTPWLSGETFPDRVPPAFWPLPSMDQLDTYHAEQRQAYWAGVANHFAQLNWLSQSAVTVERTRSGLMGPFEAKELLDEATLVLASQPQVRVVAPVEAHKVDADLPGIKRLMAAASGLIRAPLAQQNLGQPQQNLAGLWLRTDVPGVIPYVGAGADEREVRVLAWLAFLRQAQFVQFTSPLPKQSAPNVAADPDELVWFYPGSWFGVDGPVPTVQLKWLQRAEFDAEYLWLGRKQLAPEVVIARLMTKPVDLQPSQEMDPVYALLCGTSDPETWNSAIALLAREIQLNQPGVEKNPEAQQTLDDAMLTWIQPQERPILMGRKTQWGFGSSKGPVPNVVDLKVSVDIYNAADHQPTNNTLKWAGVPHGWQRNPTPIVVPPLRVFAVDRYVLDASFFLNKIADTMRQQPMDVEFDSGEDKRTTLLHLVIPVATTEQREGGVLEPDGNLHEWTAADSIQNGPLVQMCSRPSIQKHEIAMASTSTQIYSCWTNDSLCFAFRVEGLQGADPSKTLVGNNKVHRQFGRAWGEDVAELLIEPIYANRDPNRDVCEPILRIACRPAGVISADKELDSKHNANPIVLVSGIEYGATVAEETVTDSKGRSQKTNIWRAELKIPWQQFGDNPAKPALLRFNFAQHRNNTGESATWAGPVDSATDPAFTGLLQVKSKAGK